MNKLTVTDPENATIEPKRNLKKHKILPPPKTQRSVCDLQILRYELVLEVMSLPV